jgi:hypothetical protein
VQMQRDGQHEHATFACDVCWAIVDSHWQVVAGSITSVEGTRPVAAAAPVS